MKKPTAPPADLTVGAAERWKTVAAALTRRGSAIDVELLSAYCRVWNRWQEAETALAKTGSLIRDSKGRPIPNPLLVVSNQTAQQVRALEDRLGLHAAAPPAPAPKKRALLTRRELAAELGVHMMTITKWERDGMPIAERGRAGKASHYLEPDVRAWLTGREKAADRAGVVDVAQERARRERAQATLAEQMYQMRQRELLPAHEVLAAWGAEVAAVRSILLACFVTAADRVHRAGTLEGIRGIERELKAVAHEALRELADPNRAPLEGATLEHDDDEPASRPS